jgi:hypothetical protein
MKKIVHPIDVNFGRVTENIGFERDYLTKVVITRIVHWTCRVVWIILSAFEAKDWGSNPHRSANSPDG